MIWRSVVLLVALNEMWSRSWFIERCVMCADLRQHTPPTQNCWLRRTTDSLLIQQGGSSLMVRVSLSRTVTVSQKSHWVRLASRTVLVYVCYWLETVHTHVTVEWHSRWRDSRDWAERAPHESSEARAPWHVWRGTGCVCVSLCVCGCECVTSSSNKTMIVCHRIITDL